MDPFEQLVEAFNNLAAEAGIEIRSVTFDRSDVPIDWNPETRKWEATGE